MYRSVTLKEKRGLWRSIQSLSCFPSLATLEYLLLLGPLSQAGGSDPLCLHIADGRGDGPDMRLQRLNGFRVGEFEGVLG